MNHIVPVLLLVTQLGLPLGAPAAGPAGPQEIAFTQHNNVALMEPGARTRWALTTRGTGYAVSPSVVYPSYSWSPDGRYLLLVKLTSSSTAMHGEMLLFDPRGRLLRSLGTIPSPSDFFPRWAVDADQIAFVASQNPASPQLGVHHIVDRVDVAGRRSFLLAYDSQEGCGGGTGDPAAIVYWRETGFGGTTPTMQWSLTRHLAVHSNGCGAGLSVVNTQTRASRVLGTARGAGWSEGALSITGRLAVVLASQSGRQTVHRIALVDPHTGMLQRIVGLGELPLWSRTGAALFYVRRTPGRFLPMRNQIGNDTGSQAYTSALWRTDPDGRHGTRLLLQHVYGFGPLNVTRDGQTLIFSRVDNAWKLYGDYRRGRVTDAQAQGDRPAVRIQQLHIGHGVTTLVTNAGQPALQP